MALPAHSTPNHNTFDEQIDQLVEKLLANSKFDYKNHTTLITTFVWADTLTHKAINHPLKDLGDLVSETIKVRLVQNGAVVIEHKSSNYIAIDNQATYFLSRDIEDLKANIGAHYILAGTFTEIEGGANVFAQVIEYNSGEVVSAEKMFVESKTFWPTNTVVSQDGLLYRKAQSR